MYPLNIRLEVANKKAQSSKRNCYVSSDVKENTETDAILRHHKVHSWTLKMISNDPKKD